MTDQEFKAVALRYPEWAEAPYIATKAKGKVAENLVRIAGENDVPVVQNAEMAEVLSIHSAGEFIPEETYSAIAAVFAFIARIQ